MLGWALGFRYYDRRVPILNSHKTAPPKRCRLSVNLVAVAGASVTVVIGV